MTRRLSATLLVVALAIGAGACSDDDDTADADGAASSSTTDAAEITSTTTAGSTSTADPTASTVPDEGATTTVAPDGTGTTSSTVPAEGSGTTSPTTPGGDAGPPALPPSLPPASVGVPENPPLNEAGEPITLDETALLACANVQFAWVSFQQDDTQAAGQDLAIGAQRALASAVPEVSAYADDLGNALDGNDPLAVMQSFLDLCVANGFEY